ncbi:M15 family metallopeptidase [Gammaproteobacteria bacterium]|nr:M15 family metallopeptidase [Gammaproteobacteria bacterium]
MKKRQFLQAVVASGSVAFVSARLLKSKQTTVPEQLLPASEPQTPILALELGPESSAIEQLLSEENDLKPGFKHSERTLDAAVLDEMEDAQVDSYLSKIRNFDADYANDIYLSESNRQLLAPTLARLERVQNYVGHGNYNLLGFDEMLFFARNYEAIGAFESAELNFLEEIFFADANNYGFFGEKVTQGLTNRFSSEAVEKISGSGHYLLKGESLNHYKQIHQDVGERLLLTSGVRNIVKQMHLFLAKAQQSQFNLSKASRSLAPPGHSFHGIGDFDVGKIGLGELNFTVDFSNTEEFRRMISLGYIDIRYTDSNRFGVRYEPWHIKIA